MLKGEAPALLNIIGKRPSVVGGVALIMSSCGIDNVSQ